MVSSEIKLNEPLSSSTISSWQDVKFINILNNALMLSVKGEVMYERKSNYTLFRVE